MAPGPSARCLVASSARSPLAWWGSAHVAEPHHANGERAELATKHLALGPGAIVHAPVTPRPASQERQGGHHRPVGYSVGVVPSRVRHGDIELGRGLVVDRVKADSGLLHDKAATHRLQHGAVEAVLVATTAQNRRA